MSEDEVREMFGSDDPFSDFFKTFFGGAEPDTGRGVDAARAARARAGTSKRHST